MAGTEIYKRKNEIKQVNLFSFNKSFPNVINSINLFITIFEFKKRISLFLLFSK